MKSKHTVAYGKKTVDRSFYSYHINDNISHKSTVAALAQAATAN